MDDLKTINDREGHEEGDRAIWTVAAAIKKLIRGDDYVIRWGGDEFLVVLPGMDEEVARRRFYMLPSKIEEVRKSPRNDARSYKKFLSASVGVTPYSTKVPFDTAVEIADKVMYEKKKARKTMRAPGLERPAPPRTFQAPYDKPNGSGRARGPPLRNPPGIKYNWLECPGGPAQGPANSPDRPPRH